MFDHSVTHLPVVLLNTPVLTDFGSYRMRPTDETEARDLVSRHGFVSAIGHEAAARIMSGLLAIDCPVRRISYRQRSGELGIVLRLANRLPEGVILPSVESMRHHGYSLALLIRDH